MQAHLELPIGIDPSRVLLSTVLLQGSVPPHQSALRLGDFNSNGVPDLLFQFDRSAVAAVLPAGARVPVTVTGEVQDIAFFTGRDTIRVIQPHLKSPNGGESLVSGSRVPIIWENPTGWSVDHVDLSLSADDGATWVPVARGVGGESFEWTVASVPSGAARVRVDLYDPEGLIGTDSSDRAFGIGETGAKQEIGPSVHALYQNSPNPFNPRTEIRFDLPGASPVRLSVYGVDGRIVRTLIDRSMPAGRHRVTWDGTDERGRTVATGVYYYRIAAGAFRASRRLVMVR